MGRRFESCRAHQANPLILLRLGWNSMASARPATASLLQIKPILLSFSAVLLQFEIQAIFQSLHRLDCLLADLLDVDVSRRCDVCMPEDLLNGLQVDA